MSHLDGFVIFAEMRTGSNFLEETLSSLPGVTCHGEAFNPAFLGQPGRAEICGISLAQRRRDPQGLLDAMKRHSDGLPGFRFFHDHDSRVLPAILSDRRLAKIILTRNPLEAHVSRRIAEATGQWRLTRAADRVSVRIRFDPADFVEEIGRRDVFRAALMRGLQVTGQTAFRIDYAQLHDLDMMNGLARFLGADASLDRLSSRLIRQNPEPLEAKVENPDEMCAALDELGLAHLLRADDGTAASHGATPAPASWIAAHRSALLYQPLRGGPDDAVATWMAALDGVDPSELHRGFDGRALRRWKNRNKRSRSFTVVVHPVERAFALFQRHILSTGPNCFATIRQYLIDARGLPLPPDPVGVELTARDLHMAFCGYLGFLRDTLAGQTGLRQDPGFLPQLDLLRARSGLLPPDMVIRADQLALGLEQLCAQVGLDSCAAIPSGRSPGHTSLAEIHDAEIEAAVRAVYNRDYMAFGFRDWAPDPASARDEPDAAAIMRNAPARTDAVARPN